MAQYYADSKGTFLTQRVAQGFGFTGVRTSHAAGRDKPTRTFTRAVVFDENPSAGEGLVEFEPFLRTPDQAVFISTVKIIVGAGVAWELFATDGGEAAGAPNVDDVAMDASIASGTGSAIVRVNTTLPPKGKLRLTSGTVVSTSGHMVAEFFTTTDAFERALA